MMRQFILFAIILVAWSVSALASTVEPAVVTTTDGLQLKGKWTLPDTAVRGVALILPGSGNVGMDGDVSSPFVGHPHNAASAPLSAQLADALANAGVASLRYDKRGVEDQTQQPKQIVSILTKDARSALNAAKARFPGVKVALVGLSEGSMISVALATTENVDVLFLLSPPTRSIDETLHYQYVEWPLALQSSKLGFDSRGTVAISAFADHGLDHLVFAELIPAVGRPLLDYDLNHDGRLALDTELHPAYETGFGQVMQLVLGTPALAVWYNDLKALPAVRDLFPSVKAPLSFVYRGLDDANVNPAETEADLGRLAGHVELRSFPGVGHCFSPMEGSIGQVKTSGPLSADLLTAFGQDTKAAF